VKYSDDDLTQIQELAEEFGVKLVDPNDEASSVLRTDDICPDRHIPRLEEALERHVARQVRRSGMDSVVVHRYITGYWRGNVYEPATCCAYLQDETGRKWRVWYNVNSWRRTT